MPAAMARTFLVAPAISHPTTSGLVYTRNVGVRSTSWTWRAMDSSAMATTVAAGWPAAISRARFGPVSTPARWPGTTWAMTSVMRRWVPCSSPLASDSTGVPARDAIPTARSSTVRKPCDGTAMITSAAPVTASSSDAVARSDVGQDDAGEIVGVLVGTVDASGQRGAARPQHRRRRRGRHRGHGRAP